MAEKKKKVRYVDMCKYVDDNILNPNADVALIYDYLVRIARMLAVKRRFFKESEYYDQFSHFLATIVYTRMSTHRQFLDPSTEHQRNGWLSPIKSCLNYMKQIIYARKCAFCDQEFNFTTQKNNLEESEAYKAYNVSSIFGQSTDLLKVEIESYFNSLDKTIFKIVKDSVYGNDKKLVWQLYSAVLLVLLDSVTLPNVYSKKPTNVSINQFNNMHDILGRLRLKESDRNVSAYGVDCKYRDYVLYLATKVKETIISDIKSLHLDYEYSDDLLDDILMSNLDAKESLDD